MESIKLKSHVGDDGVLQIQVPVGFKNEDLEVMVIFQRLKSRDVLTLSHPDEAGFVNEPDRPVLTGHRRKGGMSLYKT